MPDPTREAALALLSAVLDRHRPLEEALDALPSAEPRDRAAAHRLAALTLRRLGSLDAVLEPLLRREPPAMVRHVLRLGAAGLLLGGTPAHAAVATAVGLARARGLAPFAGLVNAVLRRVATAGPAALEELDGPRLDTPAWLWSAWGTRARMIAEAHAREAPLDLTPHPARTARRPTGAGRRATRSADAESSGRRRRPGRRRRARRPDGATVLPTGSWRLPAGTRVAELPGFAAGGVLGAGRRRGAAGAAAGGAAGRARGGPLRGARAARRCSSRPRGRRWWRWTGTRGGSRGCGENLARTGLEAELVAADAGAWRPPVPLDAVLLDAPCTATGTVRRHPDVPHLKRPRDVEALAAGQRRLVAAAAAMLRPGGRLLYAVCSLQPEEGEAQMAAIASHGLRHDPFRPEELADVPEALTPEGWLRTHPGLWPERGGMDGFFAARFVRGYEAAPVRKKERKKPPARRALTVAPTRPKRSKVFLLLFLQKKKAFLPSFAAPRDAVPAVALLPGRGCCL